jgi:multicomponent Na+:H+ antiporter subunit D
VPDAYGYSTPTSQCVLSSLVSKGYIFLLIKIMYRVFGLEVINQVGITDVLFVFALVGMVMGSISAIRQNDIRRMIAFSSVAQIGYIYMGIGLGTDAGMMAAMFHLFSHTLCKSMLFLAAGGLADASGNSKIFRDLRGAGFRSPIAGVAFTIGALSMVGFPFLGGFVAKFNFALAAMDAGNIRALLVLIVLAISTALNTVYFLRTVITLYRKPVDTAHYPVEKGQRGILFNAALVCFALVNVALGLFSQSIVSAIVTGLSTFG